MYIENLYNAGPNWKFFRHIMKVPSTYTYSERTFGHTGTIHRQKNIQRGVKSSG